MVLDRRSGWNKMEAVFTIWRVCLCSPKLKNMDSDISSKSRLSEMSQSLFCTETKALHGLDWMGVS